MAAEQLTHVYLRRGRALELNNLYKLALQNYEAMLTDARKLHDRPMELAAQVAASTLYSTPTPVADAGKGLSLSGETLTLARASGDRATEAKVLWNLQLVNLLQNQAIRPLTMAKKVFPSHVNWTCENKWHMCLAIWAGHMAWPVNSKKQKKIGRGSPVMEGVGQYGHVIKQPCNVSLFGSYWAGRDANSLRFAEEACQISSSIKEV